MFILALPIWNCGYKQAVGTQLHLPCSVEKTAIVTMVPLQACSFAIHSPIINSVEYSPGATKKDGRILVLVAAIITGLRLARDPRAGSKTERVINAVEDGIFLANQIYNKTLLRFGQGNIEFKW
jgi:hypothetical protein